MHEPTDMCECWHPYSLHNDSVPDRPDGCEVCGHDCPHFRPTGEQGTK